MLGEEIFSIVFFVGLLSVLIQGTLLVPIAKKLHLVEDEGTVLKTFTDYSMDLYSELLEVKIPESSPYAGKTIMDIGIHKEVIFVLIRRNGRLIMPRGTTVIEAGDTIMMAGDPKLLMQIEDEVLHKKK